ncbi:MAG: replication protein [Pseudomonadota bacterium]
MVTTGEHFAGFSEPRFTSTPDEFFDRLMPTLTLAETRIVLYIIRRTFGFKKKADVISLDQLENGIRRKDGTELDRGTGLSRRAILPAIRSLIEKGVIEKKEQMDPRFGSRASLYSLRFKDSHPRGEASFSPPPGEETSPRGEEATSPHKKQNPTNSLDNTPTTPLNLASKFYRGLGRKVSEPKLRKGEEVIQDLLEKDFSEADVTYAIGYVVRKYPDTQTIHRLPFLIDEALEERGKEQAQERSKAEAKERQTHEDQWKEHAEDEARRAYEAFRRLKDEDREALLSRAPKWINLPQARTAWAVNKLKRFSPDWTGSDPRFLFSFR